MLKFFRETSRKNNSNNIHRTPILSHLFTLFALCTLFTLRSYLVMATLTPTSATERGPVLEGGPVPPRRASGPWECRPAACTGFQEGMWHPGDPWQQLLRRPQSSFIEVPNCNMIGINIVVPSTSCPLMRSSGTQQPLRRSCSFVGLPCLKLSFALLVVLVSSTMVVVSLRQTPVIVWPASVLLPYVFAWPAFS